MISRMSKIALVGPKPLAKKTLAAVQQLGVLHLDQEVMPRVPVAAGETTLPFKAPSLDEKILAERIYFEERLASVNSMLECLPEVASRIPQLSGPAVIQSLSEVADRHLREWKEMCGGAEKLRGEIAELAAHQEFIDRLNRLVERKPEEHSLCFAVPVIDESNFAALEAMLSWAFVDTATVSRRKLKGDVEVAQIRVKQEEAPRLNEQLAQLGIAEFQRPLVVDAQQLRLAWEATAKMLSDLGSRLALLEKKMETFAGRWRGVYLLAHDWLVEQLALIQAGAALYETEMCFWIFGWLPSPELPQLRETINREFGGKVVIEEEEIHEQDLDRIPIVLRNPGYFQPFELFARLLPVPRYTSFDLTPFVGLFFPLFFGMMLGDMGYGFVLLLVVLIILTVAKKNALLIDGAKVLGVCAAYTMIFGFLFGELFGGVGRRFLPLPQLLDRHQSFLPMLYFALAVGVIHVAIGLVLGTMASFRQGDRKEGVFKLGSIILVSAIALIVFSFQVESFAELKKPLLLVVGILLPLLLFTGGVMAPLEVLKTIGNIISYARIMAIGLTSVLLAYVANHLAGAIGSIWVGVLVAILLHAFNIVLGIFAPTIHSLRLHYVEFFSKFMTPGGRKFSPLGKG